MSVNLRSLNQAGDTIVEVIIVLAILGLAIGISYSTANRSLLNARQAQENSTATQLAQSQIESLRTLASVASGQPNYIFNTNTLFCISGGSVVSGFVSASGGPAPTTLAGLVDPAYGEYPTTPGTGCVQQSLYHIAVSFDDPISPNNDTFTVRVTWDDVLGQGQDTVTLEYRLHAS